MIQGSYLLTELVNQCAVSVHLHRMRHLTSRDLGIAGVYLIEQRVKAACNSPSGDRDVLERDFSFPCRCNKCH
ncbi:hypothetical protein EmuJ_000401700 [Echinococcus multilocularis]|uniref:Uncharacterized protein n=1 Tax=Echinococcus multilocularis TaxID=6211 RepID=A0A068Y155_ECHMU|nr:hypothetical protein EmuJ_000401700 [Echinococcus multilocularis]